MGGGRAGACSPDGRALSGLLDTNIVIRYLTRDPEHLALEARDIMEQEEDLQLTDVAIAESAFVLASVYQMPREAIVDGLMAVLERENIKTFRIEKDIVLEALLLCRPSRRVSIADALIWAAARSSEDKVVYTQDARFPSDGITVRREL